MNLIYLEKFKLNICLKLKFGFVNNLQSGIAYDIYPESSHGKKGFHKISKRPIENVQDVFLDTSETFR